MMKTLLSLATALFAVSLAAQPIKPTILTTNRSDPTQFGNAGGVASIKSGANTTNQNFYGINLWPTKVTIPAGGINFGPDNSFDQGTIDDSRNLFWGHIYATQTNPGFTGDGSGVTNWKGGNISGPANGGGNDATNFGKLSGTQLIITGGPNWFGQSYMTNGFTATNTDSTKVPMTIGMNGSGTNALEFRTNGVLNGGYTNDTLFVPRIIASNLVSISITADNAAAGNLGEYVESLIASGSATALTTATAKNVTSISLTGGDWDVSGNINFSASSATVTGTSGGISSTSATVPTDGSEVFSGVQVTLVSENDSVTLPRKRFSLSATTTVYLIAKSTFSAGSVSAFGQINARRVR